MDESKIVTTKMAFFHGIFASFSRFSGSLYFLVDTSPFSFFFFFAFLRPRNKEKRFNDKRRRRRCAADKERDSAFLCEVQNIVV